MSKSGARSIMIRVAISLAVAATLIGTAVAEGSGNPSRDIGRPQARVAAGAAVMSLTQVDNLSLSAAAENGDPNPSAIETVLTSRGAADNAIWPGAGAQPDPQRVYAITMVGSFSSSALGGPANASNATGNVFSIVVDAATGVATDVNLRNSSVSLASAGTVIHLPNLSQGVLSGHVTPGAKAAACQERSCRWSLRAIAVGRNTRVLAERPVSVGDNFRLVLPIGRYEIRFGRDCSTRHAVVSHEAAANVGAIACS